MPDHAPTDTAVDDLDPAGEQPEETSEAGDPGEPEKPATQTFRSRLLTAVTVLASVVFCVGTIGPPLFGKGVFLASDLLEHSFPWAVQDDSPANHAHHGPVSDTIDAVYPSRVTFFDALRDGDFLGWGPDVAGGRPKGTQSATGVLDPFAFSAYLLTPSWYAPALIKLLTMAATIGFTFLFCRRLGTDRAPALFAGIAFAGSGFMVMWTNWPQPEVAALVPALFWATERFLQRPRVVTGAPISLALAGMLLGNFPAVAFYALYLLGPYALVRVLMIHRGTVRRLLWSLGGSALALLAGVLLVAVVLIPFAIELGDVSTGDRSQDRTHHLQVPSLLTTVAPKAFGLSTEGPSGDYFGPHNQVETIAFVGVTTVLLAGLGLALPRLRSTPPGSREVLAGGTLVLGWASFVGGPLLGLLQLFPAFDNSFIGRTRSVLGFTVAVLAGLGLQALVERRWPASRRQWLGAGATLLVMAAAAGLVGWRSLSFARAAERSEVLRSNLLLPAVVGLAACGAIAVAWWFGRRRASTVAVTAAVACLPLLLVIESLNLALPLLPNEDRSTLYPTTPGTEFLVDSLDGERLVPESWALFGSASSMYGLRSAAGHSFYFDEWKEALLAVDPDAFSTSPTFPFLDGTPGIMASPLLDRMGVALWAGSPDTPPPGERVGTAAAEATCDRTVPVDDEISVEVPLAQRASPDQPDGPDGSARRGLRAIIVRVCEVGQPTGTFGTVGAEVDGRDGSTSGRVYLGGVHSPGELTVALPAEDLASPDAVTVRLAVDGFEEQGLALAATSDGQPAVDVIRPADDGLKLVYADDLRIYERTRSLGRVHWAGDATVIADEADRLEQLTSGDLPDGTVVLNEDGPATDGGPAEVDVTRDTASEISATVEAEGAGYLVVAGSVQHDWHATVDGKPADLVAADHAGGAVHVPEGRHEVELHYRPRGQPQGLAISGVTAVLMAAACLWDIRRHRQRT